MFKRILVALDRSPQAVAVFDFALSIASPQSQILLVHFIDWQMQNVSPWVGAATLYDIDVSGSRYDWSRQSLQKEIEHSKSWLENYAQKAIALEFSCQYECNVGSSNAGIGDRAKEWGADVIVMGRRGRNNLSEMILGSVSNYVIHHAPCSILVVRQTKETELVGSIK